MTRGAVPIAAIVALGVLSMLLDRRSQHAGDVAMLAAYTAAAFAGAVWWR